MQRLIPHPTALLLRALLAFACLLALPAPQAQAAPPARIVPPVQAPISSNPAGPARGTMILVHGGGWAGHDGHAQRKLLKNPGDLFLARGWRVVSIDYEEGAAGLQDVLNAAGAELARGSSAGPVCIYGESAGAHLALMAAAKLRAIDCVIGVGPPTDLHLYTVEAAASSDGRVRLVAAQIMRLFGKTPEAVAPWNLVALAPSIRADVLLVHEVDDELVSSLHGRLFKNARPTTQLLELEPGDKSNPSHALMHGTVSEAGRNRYVSGIGSFADRAVAARDAEQIAARKGCSQVTRSIADTGPKGLQNALRCLARKEASRLPRDSGRWRQTSVKLRGNVNAARVWSHLRRSLGGRRALAAAAKRRAKVIVKTGDRSHVTLRAAGGSTR